MGGYSHMSSFFDCNFWTHITGSLSQPSQAWQHQAGNTSASFIASKSQQWRTPHRFRYYYFLQSMCRCVHGSYSDHTSDDKKKPCLQARIGSAKLVLAFVYSLKRLKLMGLLVVVDSFKTRFRIFSILQSIVCYQDESWRVWILNSHCSNCKVVTCRIWQSLGSN